MEAITYLLENPTILFIVLGFIALMAAIAWGQIQTWRFDNEIEKRTGKRPFD